VDTKITALFAIIGFFFGIPAAVMAYLNALRGWSRFPGISRKKRIAFSLEMAGLALLMVLIAIITVSYIIYT
jgi:amino acid permease